ncbi:hypothetical protein V7095_07785 [Bacillus thuringiensis]|uniref:hypothetical protein n=1 Tax=Bacillus thuringiensis TaxID=1428 RepID=UPI002FFDFCE3
MKKMARNILCRNNGLILLFVTFLFFGVPIPTFAETGQTLSTSTITDINGNPVITGKPYYVKAPYSNKGGWNFETYVTTDCILLSHSDTNNGAPVVFKLAGKVKESGQPIKETDKILIQMLGSFSKDQYLNFSKKRWVYLDGTAKVFHMHTVPNDKYVNRVRFILGHSTTAHLNFEKELLGNKYWATFTHIDNQEDIMNLGQKYPNAMFTLIPAD